MEDRTQYMGRGKTPEEYFMETGFWNPEAMGPAGMTEAFSGFDVIHRCMACCAEHGRPFIKCYASFKYHYVYKADREAGYENARWRVRKIAKPQFDWAFAEMPEHESLSPLAAPLLLASDMPRGVRGHRPVVFRQSVRGQWSFVVTDQEFWDQYYDFVLNDPDCRRARGLDPLPA